MPQYVVLYAAAGFNNIANYVEFFSIAIGFNCAVQMVKDSISNPFPHIEHFIRSWVLKEIDVVIQFFNDSLAKHASL